jgi:hypothetical protein
LVALAATERREAVEPRTADCLRASMVLEVVVFLGERKR